MGKLLFTSIKNANDCMKCCFSIFIRNTTDTTLVFGSAIPPYQHTSSPENKPCLKKPLKEVSHLNVVGLKISSRIKFASQFSITIGSP